MKVLVATNQTQGTVPGDYCWTVEGELVLGAAILECCNADRCGCARGFPGLASARATTTAMVVDLPHLDRDQLATAIQESLARQGWLAALGADEIARGLLDEIELIEQITGLLPVGAVVGRHDTRIHVRELTAA